MMFNHICVFSTAVVLINGKVVKWAMDYETGASECGACFYAS